MKLVDVIILLPLLWGAMHGYRKGLLIEIIGIAGLVVAMVLGFKFLGLGMEVLSPYLGDSIARRILPYIGFSLIFFPTIFLLNQFGYAIRKSIRYSILGMFDRFAGALVGIVTWVFGISIFFWLVNLIGIDLPAHRTDDTYLYPVVVPIAPKLINKAMLWMPKGTELIQEWKSEYLEEVEPQEEKL
ncbi:membrane protein required for colicin V production [Dyadobacter jejuensis]|uniref:Membrane protein required for colicin V production n=1 Tax=Dyadobacter jejuensis TaxID=1082580 RepID=A0A316APL9_9BACT|nr:CvpA family protein [Dyadobacter jejuensis]PWJ59366.1 membrane protein required for colicin V production [Dyadobacter jejuensis]